MLTRFNLHQLTDTRSLIPPLYKANVYYTRTSGRMKTQRIICTQISVVCLMRVNKQKTVRDRSMMWISNVVFSDSSTHASQNKALNTQQFHPETHRCVHMFLRALVQQR